MQDSKPGAAPTKVKGKDDEGPATPFRFWETPYGEFARQNVSEKQENKGLS